MVQTHQTEQKPQVDPSLLAASPAGADDFPIDPALYEIDEVVQDVRKGKIRLQDESGHEVGVGQQDGQALSAQITGAGVVANAPGHDIEDDGIDPALREIVNSLTNAQQSSHVVGPGLTHAQAAVAIGAHLTDNEERERLQQSLQTTLDDLAQASFGSLFPNNYPSSPTNHTFLLPSDEHNAQSGPSTLPDSTIDQASGSYPPITQKRGRGRPKGSKNKPKPGQPPRPPKPSPPPRRPKGRPPKTRTVEEQADYQRRKEEKTLGIKRKKGRPRKFPGYLIREMRLKRNRGEFNDLVKRHEGESRDGEEGGQQDEMYASFAEGDDDGQSFLDVVGAARLAGQREQGESQMELDEDTYGAGPSRLQEEDEGVPEVSGMGEDL